MSRKRIESSMPHPLVAIDMGHTVRTMAAERNEAGLLRVLGVESSGKTQYVERGVVTNTSGMSFCVNEMLKLLANRIHHDNLVKAFVPLGGRSMQIVEVSSKRNQLKVQPISSVMLDDMEMECKKKIETHNPLVAVLDLIPSQYILDGVPQKDVPSAEQEAQWVEVNYSVFVGKKELEQKVKDSFVRIPKHIEHAYARPDALMCALASEEDMQNGCAILDMGAQTTTLTVYKNDRYIYNRVLSQGGYDISRDIEQLGVSFAYAERLKCDYGCACAQTVEKNNVYRVPSPNAENGVTLIKATDLADVIANRLDQILNPLMAELSNLSQSISVLYITGGASMLFGVEAYVQSKTTIPVMYGSHAPWLTADTPDEYCAPNYSSLVGTLLLGGYYRDLHPTKVYEDALISRLHKLKKKVEEQTLIIFSDTENE